MVLKLEEQINVEQAEIDRLLFGDVIVGYYAHQPGFNFVHVMGSIPEMIIDDLKRHGNVVIESRESVERNDRDPHWYAFGPMSNMHKDAAFCETGWSGAVQAENEGTRWWDLPKRQSAIEQYFNVPAGTFKE